MNNYDKLYFAANLLIDISEDRQKDYQSIKNDGYTSLGFAKEIRTIRIATSRGSGHTECIRKLINNRFNKNVMLILNNQNMIEEYIRPEPSGSITYPIFSFYNIDNIYRGRDYSNLEAIIVDTSTYSMSKNEEDELYKNIFPAIYPQIISKTFFFIFVQ